MKFLAVVVFVVLTGCATIHPPTQPVGYDASDLGKSEVLYPFFSLAVYYFIDDLLRDEED